MKIMEYTNVIFFNESLQHKTDDDDMDVITNSIDPIQDTQPWSSSSDQNTKDIPTTDE